MVALRQFSLIVTIGSSEAARRNHVEDSSFKNVPIVSPILPREDWLQRLTVIVFRSLSWLAYSQLWDASGRGSDNHRFMPAFLLGR